MTGKSPRRGEIYWVSLDPTVGAETKKTRPCLIVSNDIGNAVSDIVTVAPITSNIDKVFSFEVEVEIAGKRGKVMLNQCRAIDKSRLENKACCLDSEIMKSVDEAIRISFGLS